MKLFSRKNQNQTEESSKPSSSILSSKIPGPIRNPKVMLAIGLFCFTFVTFSVLVWLVIRVVTFKDVAHEKKIQHRIEQISHLGEEEHQVKEFQFSYEVKSMVMSLTDKSNSRVAYAQYGLMLDCPSEKARHRMDLDRAKLQNAILEVGGKFRIEDFKGPEGIVKFRVELEKTLQEIFKQDAPRKVAVQNWTVQ